MRLDHNGIDAMMTWGRTWANLPPGEKIRLEIASNERGMVICDVYRRDPRPEFTITDRLHPIISTKVGEL